MGNNAVVQAPPAQIRLAATVPGGEQPDERLILLEENRALRQDLDRAHIATRTMASVAVALARMLADNEGKPLDREVVLPRSEHEKMAGAEVAVREDLNGDLVVHIVDNVKHPIWEGR